MKMSKLAASLMLPFALAACGDTAHEKIEKPAIVASMVKDSLAVCNTGPKNNSDQDYSDRLGVILMKTYTSNLKALQSAKVTVCLDQRLSEQVTGTWDRRMDGVFYNTDGKKIVSLWDNGKKADDKRGALEMTSYTYGDVMLDKVAKTVNAGDTLIAARYSCGKGCISTWWTPRADFDQDSIRKNPDLLKPPSKPGL